MPSYSLIYINYTFINWETQVTSIKQTIHKWLIEESWYGYDKEAFLRMRNGSSNGIDIRNRNYLLYMQWIKKKNLGGWYYIYMTPVTYICIMIFPVKYMPFFFTPGSLISEPQNNNNIEQISPLSSGDHGMWSFS